MDDIAVPFESCLIDHMSVALVGEIASGALKNRQDCVDWLTWSFLYRRLAANPNFYGLEGRSHRNLSEGMSEMVENAVEALSHREIVTLEGEDMFPQGMAVISGFYGLSPETVSMISKSMKPSTKIRGVFEILAASIVSECSNIRLKGHDWSILKEVRSQVPIRIELTDLDEESVKLRYKVHLILQLYLSNFPLESFSEDLRSILSISPRILHAIVDVASSQAMLTPALTAMDLCQMITQGVWAENLLHQVKPFREYPQLISDLSDALSKLKNEPVSISSIYDLYEI